MLAYDDTKWKELKGGYKVLYDPTPSLKNLERGVSVKEAWEELWQELHHQSDVDEASYATVPHLVRIQQATHSLDWNLYALASVIETERHRKTNPPLPVWLAESYHQAWKLLTELAIEDLRHASDATTIQALLGAIALGKGQLLLGNVITTFTQDEFEEILEEHVGWAEFYQPPTASSE